MEPQRTITALDRFKQAPTERKITALDRFRTGTPAAATLAPTEPKGLFLTMAKQTPEFISTQSKAYMQRERESQAVMSIGEKARQSFITRPAAILKFLAQGTAQGILGVGKTVQDALPKAVSTVPGSTKASKERQKQREETILGSEVQSAQDLYRSIKGFVDSSELSTPWEKKYAPIILASAAFIADAIPSKPNGKKVSEGLLEELAKSIDVADVEERMIREGIDPRLAARTANTIANTPDAEGVRQILLEETGNDLRKLFDGEAEVTPAVSRATEPNVPPVSTVTPTVPDARTRMADTVDAAAARRAADVDEDLLTEVRRARDEGKTFDDFVNDKNVLRQLFDSREKKIFEVLNRVQETGKTEYVKGYRGYGTNYTKSIDEAASRKDDVLSKGRLYTDGKDDLMIADNYEQALYYADGIPENVIEFDVPITKDASFSPDDSSWVYRVKDGEPIEVPIKNAKIATPATNRSQLESIWKEADVKPITTPDLPTVKVGNKEIRVNDGPPAEKLQADPEVIDDLKDLVRRDQMALRPTSATGKIEGRDLAAEMAANIKRYSDKMTDTEVAAMRNNLLLDPETLGEFILRKRGIITDKEAAMRASNIKGTIGDVLSLPKGTTVTKEVKLAIDQIINEEWKIVKRLQKALDEGITTGGAAERKAIAERFGKEYKDVSDELILRQTLAESLVNLKKAEMIRTAIASETGRSLQSQKMFIEGIDKRIRILTRQINNSKKLEDIDKNAMLERIAHLDTSDDKVFVKTLDELSQSDYFDNFREWAVAAKLWNPTTHVVNFGGNGLRMLIDIVIKTTTNPGAVPADMAGFAVGLKTGLKNSLRALTDDGYASSLSKYVEAGGSAPAIKGTIGKYARTPFRLLAASDEIFSNIAYQRQMYRDAYTTAKKEKLSGRALELRMQEILNTPNVRMLERAAEEAKKMTFAQDLGDFMQKINALRDPSEATSIIGKTSAVGVSLFLPFLKTPTNIFKQSIDFTPIGLAKNWGALKKAAKEGDKDKFGTILGEVLFGSAVMAYIAMEAGEGNITGGAPTNPAERDQFYREKKLPYAIKINGQWYQYQRLDPFALLLGMTTDMVNNEDKDISSLAGVVSGNLKDKTYLSGLSDMLNLLTGDDWERDAAFNSMVLGATMPSIIGHTARSIDPVVRDADTLGERLLAQIPGASQSLPARVNVLGYSVERANKGLNYFFNPIQSASAEIDPVTRELLKIDHSISIPNKNFVRDDTSYTLNNEEYEDFARFTGIRLRSEMVNLFKKPSYKRADIEEKQKMINALRTEIMDEWKDAYVDEQGKTKSLDEIFGQNRPSLADIFK